MTRRTPLPQVVAAVLIGAVLAAIAIAATISAVIPASSEARTCARATSDAAAAARVYVERTLSTSGTSATATSSAEVRVTTLVGRPVTVDLTCTRAGWSVREAQRTER